MSASDPTPVPSEPRRTPQREAVLDAMRDARGPLSPVEIHRRASDRVPTIGLSTVYRLLRRLESERRIAPVELPGEATRYELAEVAHVHHHHFHCTSCQQVYDVDGCPTGLAALLPARFTLTGHDIVLYGVCDECGATDARS